jgi:hypothetical protein
MDRWHGDETLDRLTSHPESVAANMQHPYAYDVDGHDGTWWAQCLRERDFFENLNDHDRAVMLAGVMRLPVTSWSTGLQKQIKAAIKDAIEE